jgi:hypothetical protein
MDTLLVHMDTFTLQQDMYAFVAIPDPGIGYFPDSASQRFLGRLD